MIFSILPKQPHPILSYIRVGQLLYGSLVLFVFESYFFWIKLEGAYTEFSLLLTVIWLICFLFSFVHVFLVIMDGWSRFQNYKRAKDLFYTHGFNKRIADNYMGSKCQRMAAIVAADELGIGNSVKEYYTKKKVKWYHFVPYFMIKEPLFFFKDKFWARTFLEKNYKPKFDYRNLQSEPKLQS